VEGDKETIQDSKRMSGSWWLKQRK